MPYFIEMMRNRTLVIIGGVLIAIGLILGRESFVQYLRSRGSSSNVSTLVSQPVQDTPEVPVITGKPERIKIKSLTIDLPIIDGYYNEQDKTWTLSEDKVQYATTTPQNNNKQGNTYLYGHNNGYVFSQLYRLQAGDRVVIYTANDHKFTYEFTSSFETDPYDSSVFDYSGPPILTIQTCSGLWFENRQLFTFKLVEVA